MKTHTELLAVKLPAEMDKAIRAAEAKTGANRSELAREAIACGLKQAVSLRLKSAKRTRELLAFGN